MSEKDVVLEQRPERWRRHPVLTLSVVGLLFWPLWYLRSKTEKLTITESRVIYREGIISKNEIELSKDEIKQATVQQGMVDRIFNMGTLSITTGGDVAEIAIRGFYNPDKIKELCRE